ncbi:hypothetical protein BKA67DRAFT_515561 [Truncatella angustata]|uniref:Uncharacterized protein n=1 Tax=Truncatella angustata TaxID=152316 RepID=A0A9P8UNW3_9PEZI|nr:uncharacterized protein BKA67DRAFT_515561 [Truncatella angustata]KAH6655421.1 hypothetical protein BKA67DRAFT_515561 [Truncatella angustata]KAH8199525.1 hypothetical protein TruAng_006338 [Truncatella angustata]
MSVNTWLQRQRKMDLTELAEHTGLKNYEAFKKPELELALDEYLAENSTQFASDPRVAPYYSARDRAISSPVKRGASPIKRGSTASATPVETLRVTKRRVTKAIEDAVAPDSDEEPAAAPSMTTALVQTPGRALSLAQRIPLPATPADVAEAVDRGSVILRNRATSLYKESGITEATQGIKEDLSTVNSILFVISLFESWFLRPEVLPDRYAFTIPAIDFLGTNDHPIQVPDLFLLLTSSFWSPFLLWLFTSFLLPTAAGYFFNLSAAHQPNRRARTYSSPEYVVDPLTFSIVKALISFVVYGQNVTFGGWVNEQSIARVDGALYGGYKGILTGAAITGLVSIYDAILKK